jgi:hypothetical protein
VRTIFVVLTAMGLVSAVTTATFCDPIFLMEHSWGLHYAGPHNSKVNTCGLTVVRCFQDPQLDLVAEGPQGPGRFDIYIVALGVYGIQGTRFGLCSNQHFYFYQWTSCGDSQLYTPGWPGCGEGVSVIWNEEQPGPFVTIGILDVYAYPPVSTMEICPDPRVDYCGWFGSAIPQGYDEITDPRFFGVIGFGTEGYNPFPCPPDPVERNTWGRIKATYR